MNTYKIRNITDHLGKRHPNYNSVLDIGFVDQMERKSMKLEPNKTIFFTATALPLSLHRFRMKGLVSVSEITEQELLKIQKDESKKDSNENSNVVKKPKPVTTTTTTKKNYGKPKSTKKTTTYKKNTDGDEKEEDDDN